MSHIASLHTDLKLIQLNTSNLRLSERTNVDMHAHDYYKHVFLWSDKISGGLEPPRVLNSAAVIVDTVFNLFSIL